ncbi:hypothetical protein HL658_35645 [Azospirillum sp. RWY-5-1]|uniref:Glycosyltransferase n=1 Tax=Azospirillum oleiclasticum TaxID=2735135 RepID=A0ABX2TLS9_9PROT|nr:hypothetical protein [Azospirillum oleiclasticum]NYZ17906.1 hypothetical protein [Azospirillum oleiclasticum]NYZ25119.1 hypothetical protein [Azospirillum oleiclasticum]
MTAPSGAPALGFVVAAIDEDPADTARRLEQLAATLARQAAAARQRAELVIVHWMPRATVAAPAPTGALDRLDIVVGPTDIPPQPFPSYAELHGRRAQNIGLRRSTASVLAVLGPDAVPSDALFARLAHAALRYPALLVAPEWRLDGFREGMSGALGDIDLGTLQHIHWVLGGTPVSAGNAAHGNLRPLWRLAATALVRHRVRPRSERRFPVLCRPGAPADALPAEDAEALGHAVTGHFLAASREVWMRLRGLPELLARDHALGALLAIQARANGIATRTLGFKAPVLRLAATEERAVLRENTDPGGELPMRLSFTPYEVAGFGPAHLPYAAEAFRMDTCSPLAINALGWGFADQPLTVHRTPALTSTAPTGRS